MAKVFRNRERGPLHHPEFTMVDTAGRPRLDRAQLSAKADDLDRTVRRLSALRDGLRHAAACPAPSHMECPTFRRLLKGALETRRRGFVEDLG